MNVQWITCQGVPMSGKMFPLMEDYPRDDSYRSALVTFSAQNGERTDFQKEAHVVSRMLASDRNEETHESDSTDSKVLPQKHEMKAESPEKTDVKAERGVSASESDLANDKVEPTRGKFETAKAENDTAEAEVENTLTAPIATAGTATKLTEPVADSDKTYADHLQSATNSEKVRSDDGILKARNEPQELAGDVANENSRDQAEKSYAMHSPENPADNVASQRYVLSLKAVNDTPERKSTKGNKRKDTCAVPSSPKKMKTEEKRPVPISAGILDEECETQSTLRLGAFSISLKEEMKKDAQERKAQRQNKQTQQKGEISETNGRSVEEKQDTVEEQSAKQRAPEKDEVDANIVAKHRPASSSGHAPHVKNKVERGEKNLSKASTSPRSPTPAKKSILSMFKPAQPKKTLITKEYVNDKGEFISEDVYE